MSEEQVATIRHRLSTIAAALRVSVYGHQQLMAMNFSDAARDARESGESAGRDTARRFDEAAKEVIDFFRTLRRGIAHLEDELRADEQAGEEGKVANVG